MIIPGGTRTIDAKSMYVMPGERNLRLPTKKVETG